MATLILTSDGFDSLPIEKEFRRLISSETKVAVITSAKEGEVKAKAEEKNKLLFSELFSPKLIDFIDLEFDSAKKLLNYDFIFILGGNPFRLQHIFNNTNAKAVFDKLMLTNKTIAGVSAGSMCLGNNIGICNYLSPEMNDVALKDFTGLCLTNINICPHCNNFPDRYENFETKLNNFCNDTKTKITKLYDGEAIIIDTKTNKTKKIKGEIITGR